MTSDRRYHIAFNGYLGKWICHDYDGGVIGTGDSVMKSYWDCVVQLEIATIRPPTISQFAFT